MTSSSPGSRSNKPVSWLKVLWDSRLQYETSEGSTDFLAFLVPKLWPKYRKLIREIPRKSPTFSDRFTHRPNRPWSRVRAFGGPAQLFPMTTQYLKFCKTAQRHNFTICLETIRNANVYSRLLSVQ